MKLKFSLQKTSDKARAGRIQIGKINIDTPVFMPVGTSATVKAMVVDDLHEIGFKIILANSYHLHLRPGDQLIARLNGLHQFMNWDQAILTDSGGFQVFSLNKLAKINNEGVLFRNHLDGKQIHFTPASVIQIQENLNSNIMMVFDECLSIPSHYSVARQSMQRTMYWAKQAKEAKTSQNNLFGIVQGAEYFDLRRISAEQIRELDFDGNAIGGLSVGEEKSIMYELNEFVCDILPEEKPRYLMGVGEPVDMLHAIEGGIDMMDCVLPTRNARNGQLLTYNGPISIKKKIHQEANIPIDENCQCKVCRQYSRAYLRHLFKVNEILSSQLNSYHNLYFMFHLMQQARAAILEGRFTQFKKTFIANYQTSK